MTATKRGWSSAILGALLGALALSACKDARDDESPSARTPRPGDVAAASAPACGWVPANAREATPVASLRANPAADPMCDRPASILDTPRAAIASLEKELRESTKMSDEEENRIGRRLEAGLRRERSFAGKLDLPEDVRRYGAYVRDIVDRLAAHSTRPGIHYRIHFARVPVFNAAALPGGVLLVFTGTLEGREAVRDEAELAAVLGHEITHVERRHVVAAYQFARAALGDQSDEAVLAMRVLTQPLSSEHELEADDRGTELAVLAQYNPKAVVDLWRRHAQTERHMRPHRRGRGDVLDEVMEGVEELLQSHPPSAVRACHAMEKLAWAREHAPCPTLYDGRTNLVTRVPGPSRPY